MRTKPGKMTGCLLAAVLTVAVSLPMTGCAIIGGGNEPTPVEQVQMAGPILEEAAFWGVKIYLQDNPGHKPGFILGVATIDALVTGDIDYESLEAILGDLGGQDDPMVTDAIASAVNLLASYRPQFDLMTETEEGLVARQLMVYVRNGIARAVDLKRVKVPKE